MYTTFIWAQKGDNFSRLVDSAEVYVHDNPQLSWNFLDSIPNPVTQSLKGHLADYYLLKGMLYYKSDEHANIYNSLKLAIKYGKIEENYEVVGQASLDLFSHVFVVKKDSTANKYLKQAKKYFTLARDKNGLIEVTQMPAYIAFQNHEYAKSNSLLLENLETYKNAENDAYYYLFALFMLTDNYAHLNDLENANKYRKIFKSLKNDPTIDNYNFSSYNANLNVCMASLHLAKEQIDSAMVYLSYANKSQDFLDYVARRTFYLRYSEAYDLIGNREMSKLYLDSLNYFEEEMLNKNITASYNITENLMQSEEALKTESNLKILNRNWLIALFIILLFLIGAFIVYFKNINRRINHFINQRKSYSQLSSNYEKLKVKTLGLEEYISELKKEIKSIAARTDTKEQRGKIKDLYKNIHLQSSSVISNGEDHLKLINELNIDFFSNLKARFPKLSESDMIVCYYLAMDFKNKDIALFLNRSIRAVESKRYRISKKIGLDENTESLATFLATSLKQSEQERISAI
ncbi:hypothetical protein K8089_11905 [Aequorivita sp. F47161]|uniref:HTH luxR-type domain-containing protein n=1 Tax=Aequorivita vitellina TaxID=2874475 RepID=A0A9X1R037_9FLAO|nr:hypothetical protein [Aequorivita vitellina]MCG2419729.1 hypothetical protein [Aequorivita vitellina]